MEIIVVNPYYEKIYKVLKTYYENSESRILLVGDKNKILDIARGYEFRYEIVDIANEDKIIEYVHRNAKRDSLLIIGTMLDYNKRKLFNLSNEEELGLINVLNIEGFDEYLFTSIYSKKKYSNFENRKKSIINAYSFMIELGIKKSKVGLIYSDVNKSDLLEVNIIKMIESSYKNLKILGPMLIKEAFEMKDKFLNLLVFKNYDITKTFIETISCLDKAVIASIGYRDTSLSSFSFKYFIEFDEVMNEKDFLFTLLVISKAYKVLFKNVHITA